MGLRPTLRGDSVEVRADPTGFIQPDIGATRGLQQRLSDFPVQQRARCDI